MKSIIRIMLESILSLIKSICFWSRILLLLILMVILSFMLNGKIVIWVWPGLFLLGVIELLTNILWYKITEESPDEDNTKAPWFAAVVIIIISYLIIFIGPKILTNSDSYNYLLSSINQSLSALFALVFALMFTLAELSKNSDKIYVHRDTNKQVSKIFSGYVLLFIISFVISILMPLFLMGTKNIIGVKVVLFHAICNVAMLIPFFWRFKITLTSKK